MPPPKSKYWRKSSTRRGRRGTEKSTYVNPCDFKGGFQASCYYTIYLLTGAGGRSEAKLTTVGNPKTLIASRAGLMCPTSRKSSDSSYSSAATSSEEADDSCRDWRWETINGGSLRHVDLDGGTNGWASPPGDLFLLRGKSYLTKRQKVPSGDWLLKPAGVDWLRSPTRLDNVLARPDNRVAAALRRDREAGRAMKAFLVAVNLQIPGRECHSAVFYFAADEERPIAPGSLLYRFIHGDDAFRNQRFKLVNRIVKGPWIVKKAVGNYAACLLGKALRVEYHRGENYLEIDVDIGSSAIANAILHLALGYVTSVTIDMGFAVEAQEEEDLPERLFGAVRVAQMEMSAATFVDTRGMSSSVGAAESAAAGKGGFRSSSKVVNHQNSWRDRSAAEGSKRSEEEG